MVQRDYKFLSVYGVEWCIARKSEMNSRVLLHARGCSLHNSSLFLNSILMKLMWSLIIMIGPLTTGTLRRINKRKKERHGNRDFFFFFPHFIFTSYNYFLYEECLSLGKYFSQITAAHSPVLQLQQAIGNHSKACPEGKGKENESSKYRQWPLQTPSMINVKGFLFLICQSF